MSEVRKKRPAERQSPEEQDRDAKESSPKRQALGFSFRPSSLNKATREFSLKQSSLLKPSADPLPTSSPTTAANETTGAGSVAESRKQAGGFLKLSAEEITPINITTPTIMTSGGGAKPTNQAEGGSRRPEGTENHNDIHRENPFLQFLSTSGATTQTFSSLLNSGRSSEMVSTSSNIPSGTESGNSTSQEDSRDNSQDARVSSDSNGGPGASTLPDPLHPSTPQLVPFGSQPATALLPEIQTPTGEEGERKIVQVPARLYAFDAAHHSWKERGRGEVRLNDACQSEGVFQSRLVMRQSGSYRVLVNTHLWAQMKCDRANQKSIRITAQCGEGEVAVFLIMGVVKDIQQLYTAIDRRIEALRINMEHQQEQSKEAGEAIIRGKTSPALEEEEEEEVESFLDEPHSSPDSSPEAHPHRQEHVPIPDQSGTGTETDPADTTAEVKEKEEDSQLSPHRSTSTSTIQEPSM